MKRDIFAELMDGLDALADERQGKITLRTHKVHLPELMPITAQELVAIRNQPLPLGVRHVPTHQYPNPGKLGTGTCNA